MVGATTLSEYKEYIHKERGGRYIDVLSLVSKYREVVNPKVNIFSVQVAGYDNTVLPEDLYRGAILTGWTGKEPIYANSLIKAWDLIEGLRAPWFSTKAPRNVEKATKERLELGSSTAHRKVGVVPSVKRKFKKFSLESLITG